MRYDPFQARAIAAIDQHRSVLVSAPTGAGKTAIAEYAIQKALAAGERTIYTAPVKALSNQKFRDFTARYPDKVGILTGDVSLNPDAPIVIMTTEIYRNQLFEDPERLKSTRWVIFDEVHYLDDAERGTVWEEAIMFSPEQVRLIALSATAPNIEEVAEWIRGILDHPIEVIIETHRPVPLVHLFQCQNRIYDDIRELRRDGYMGRDNWPSEHGGHRSGGHRPPHRHRGGPQRWERQLRAHPNRTEDLVRHLIEKGRLPCLYFAFGRRRAEELAWDQERFDFLTPEERVQVARSYDELLDRFELSREPSAADMKRLIHKGVAFHHAGMLPTLKEVIERLFTSRLIKMIFTTETFAIGINMPAKAVVFDELRKFYGTHFGYLRTRDYFQMAGRAGRRGMDAEGYVYSRVNPHMIPAATVQKVVYSQPEPIESQFNSCYATLLNLYAQFGQRLLEIYPRSFHHFQSNKKGRQRGVAAIERKLALLRDLGHTGPDGLTQKGQFASWMYGYELILSEMMEGGALDQLDALGLSILLCSLVFEPRKNQFCPQLPPNMVAVARQAERFLRRVHQKEAQHRVWPYTKHPHFHLARALEAWMGGCRFMDLAEHTDVDEGEIIRYFRMVIQLLRQIRQAPHASARLREAAGAAFDKINRDLVDAERQLRNLG
ncbi:MAG: hypothetical protein MOGMAGMI_00795 [Candidatus Omnitrophica bacterium]|nr:hypothetical protein [Candidatus Omnitrophota bacterium]